MDPKAAQSVKVVALSQLFEEYEAEILRDSYVDPAIQFEAQMVYSSLMVRLGVIKG